MNSILSVHPVSRRLAKGLMLAVAGGALALAGISAASAQSTAGAVFGKGPAGYSVSVRSPSTGAGRTVTVNAEGRYSARELPVGSYTVTLKNGSKAIAEHLNVPVGVGHNSEVDFDCSKLKCGENVAKQ